MSSQATKMTPTAATKTTPAPDQVQAAAEEPRSHEEQLAILAYRLWQERGSPDGSPEVDWLRAEQELQLTEK